MNDHSQNGEATIIRNYFAGRVGTLIDIGAYDGKALSNSYDLILSGWKGDLLEPDIRTFTLLEELYKDNSGIKTYNLGIASETGEKDFYYNSMLSTLHESNKKSWEKYTKGTAHFKSWADFYQGGIYNFVSIDAEGADFEILQQMDLKQMGTELVCAEYNGDRNMLQQMIQYCEGFGLKKIKVNNENLIMAL